MAEPVCSNDCETVRKALAYGARVSGQSPSIVWWTLFGTPMPVTLCARCKRPVVGHGVLDGEDYCQRDARSQPDCYTLARQERQAGAHQRLEDDLWSAVDRTVGVGPEF